ncbi:hypothetical protein SY88_11695 [Clostridiales bacterium PH28_bin88]|nr:hypothetical protein SY88_11695 [Clostridiales bacterium PH28_bin88]
MKRRIAFVGFFLAFCLTGYVFLVAGSALAFEDVKGHWAQLDIDLLSSHGVIDGYTNGAFQPKNYVTRAEFAKILIKALGAEDEVWTLETVPSVFRDVGAEHWARGYIQLAYELGIIRGFDDGSFRPGDYIRRMDMATMLVRALRIDGQSGVLPAYTDAAQIPAWAQHDITIASERKLVGGFPDNTFRPRELATRAEAAAMVNRLMDEFGSKYDFYSNLESVDGKSGKIGFTLNGQRVEVNLSAKAKTYLGGQPARLEDAAKDLPRPAFVNLDSEGAATFVQVLTAPLDDAVQLKWSSSAAGFSSEATNYTRKLGEEIVSASGELSAASPGRSLEITKQEAGASKLASLTGADGRGVLIAIIDTGIDPTHPDLQVTSTGSGKVVDFKDYTDEGRVATAGTLPSGHESYTIGGQQYSFKGLYSQSGNFRYGFLEEARAGVDLNGNGSTSDRFLVVVTDPWEAGRYDLVYVDTDGDRNLANEVPLREYRLARGTASFPSTGQATGVSFVISEIKTGAREVVLGFDGNGHGTQVAGVVAANGTVKGVAPGAQLLVIKALDKNGQAAWDRLAEAIRYAAQAGAKVINLSLANYQDMTSGYNSLTQLVDRVSAQNGIVFTVAAGNKGPGLASLATPGNARSAIGVGAYISPAMWLEDYGYRVPRETLWYFSSVGPRQDGMMGPTVVAPGSTVSTSPTWMGTGYSLVEGTSVAAAHTAGVAAMLLDSASRSKLNVSPASIKQAIISGARAIKHFNAVEAGAGALDAAAAWTKLRDLPPTSPVVAYTYNRQLGMGEGLYARDFIPGQLSYNMVNQGNEPITVFWETMVPWMRTVPRQTLLPTGINRRVALEYQVPDEPGVYTGFIKGIVPTTPGMELRLMSTVIRPYLLTPQNDFRQELEGGLEAGQHRRYFFRVPPGTNRATFSLKVPLTQGQYEGRVRFHLISPDGQEVIMSDYVGLGPEGTIVQGYVTKTVENPKPGNWEMVVYSSAALSLFGKDLSSYQLAVQLDEINEKDSLKPRWVIGLLPRELVPGRPTYVTLQVRDPQTLRPVDTVLEIDGRVMEVQRGRVTFPITPSSKDITISIN